MLRRVDAEHDWGLLVQTAAERAAGGLKRNGMLRWNAGRCQQHRLRGWLLSLLVGLLLEGLWLWWDGGWLGRGWLLLLLLAGGSFLLSVMLGSCRCCCHLLLVELLLVVLELLSLRRRWHLLHLGHLQLEERLLVLLELVDGVA